MTSTPQSPFERSGLGALSDLQTVGWMQLVAELDRQQRDFLEHEATFRSPAYKWPRDALHTWSRTWEYPYAHHHLRAFAERRAGDARAKVVDFGSGVTFFPFAVARLGFDVICADIDSACGIDLGKAADCVPHKPGTVDFRHIDGARLPFDDGEIDALYCISVLEHIPQPEQVIAELARIVAPGGLLLVTFDLDLRGDSEIGVEPHRRLVDALYADFDVAWPETTTHPADMLRTDNGPHPLPAPPPALLARGYVKQQIIKPLLGRKPSRYRPPLLAVHGLTLKRR